MEPSELRIFDRYSNMVDAIEKALTELRSNNGDDKVALASLAQIEKAVVEARQQIWDRRARKAAQKK